MRFVLFVLFVLFVCVKSSCRKKKKRFKIALIPSFTMLLTCTPLNLPMKSYLYTLIFIYDHLSECFPLMRIFSVYENLFLIMILCKNLFFMRTFLNLFLSMIICENLFFFMINYFITYFLLHLPICAYLFSSSFIIQNLFSVCIHLDQYELKIFMNINN